MIAISGSRTAIWRISARFFSPPLNPSFTYRPRTAGSSCSTATAAPMSRAQLQNVVVAAGEELGDGPRVDAVETDDGAGGCDAKTAGIRQEGVHDGRQWL